MLLPPKGLQSSSHYHGNRRAAEEVAASLPEARVAQADLGSTCSIDEMARSLRGKELDIGTGFDQFPSELRDEIVARYPREHFKEGFVEAVFGGFAHKPGTTYGTAFVGVSERFISGYKSPNVCDLIAASPFPDSELQS